MSHTLTIDVSASTQESLQKIAASRDETINDLVEEALDVFIAQEKQRERIAVEAYQALQKEKAFVSQEAVEKWVKSWGTKLVLPRPKPDVFR